MKFRNENYNNVDSEEISFKIYMVAVLQILRFLLYYSTTTIQVLH